MVLKHGHACTTLQWGRIGGSVEAHVGAAQLPAAPGEVAGLQTAVAALLLSGLPQMLAALPNA